MKKVLTMTMNPCIDKTLYFDSFQAGATNVVKKVIEEAAGKGINVAIGLQHLRVPVKALGFAFKEDKGKLYGKLDAEQIPYSFIEVEGRLRINQKLFDETKAMMTECNEKGMPVTETDVDKLLQLLKSELKEAAVLVLSGSVPPGVETDIYSVMTSMANEAGVKVILDASGSLLLEGVKEGPYLIKPNWDEFVKTFPKCKESVQEALDTETKGNKMFGAGIEMVAGQLMKHGISYICLSMGADGAILWSKSTPDAGEASTVVREERPAIPVSVRSLQGAGDAMVAGLCKAIYEREEDKMLDYALAMAASTIMLEGTQMGDIR